MSLHPMNRNFFKLIPYFRQIPVQNFSLTHSLKSVSKEIVESLERLALVDFSTAAGIERLGKSIKFADKLMEVNTSNVEPLFSTVYDRNENLSDDEPINKSYRKELMKVAPVSEEFYYVAPMGTFTSKKAKNVAEN